MFDKLFDLIVLIWNHIIPVKVIPEYERGIRLRYGKLKPKVLNPGLHFKIPIADVILTDVITKDTLDIKEVNITTADDITITVGCVLEFCIHDIIKHTIFTNTAKGNIHDICRSIVASHLTQCTYLDCRSQNTIKIINKLVAKKCKEMGVTVLLFTFTDMSKSKVYKLFSNMPNPTPPTV